MKKIDSDKKAGNKAIENRFSAFLQKDRCDLWEHHELPLLYRCGFSPDGLAAACVRQMLCDRQKRGITVHWDAQNDESHRLAEKFGFQIPKNCSVYIMKESTVNG